MTSKAMFKNEKLVKALFFILMLQLLACAVSFHKEGLESVKGTYKLPGTNNQDTSAADKHPLTLCSPSVVRTSYMYASMMSTKLSQTWKRAFLSSRYERLLNFLICSFSSPVKVTATKRERERLVTFFYRLSLSSNIAGRYSQCQSLPEKQVKLRAPAGCDWCLWSAVSLRKQKEKFGAIIFKSELEMRHEKRFEACEWSYRTR